MVKTQPENEMGRGLQGGGHMNPRGYIRRGVEAGWCWAVSATHAKAAARLLTPMVRGEKSGSCRSASSMSAEERAEVA